MTGTFVNVGAVIAGSLIGLMINRRLNPRFTNTVFQAIGLFTVFLGISMALKTDNILLIIFSLVLGAITGELLRIDKGIERFSDYLKRKLKSRNDRFSEGLITSFLLFCMGSMTILGAIEEGLGDEPNLLLAKSLMDGFSSIALASAMGIGVLFSVVPLLIYQGGITLFAEYFQEHATELFVNELTAVGGILLLGLGISILDIKKVNIVNMLPALIYILVLVYFFG
ncbi:MAG: DUF554 domain-containing protein [Bacteroidales bacterium]|nr:DUF554 domain-containing protein [Bacteroidales bacterium]MCF8334615.1 DUF554 domain-containing protein [Bacteroidales bacterium]